MFCAKCGKELPEGTKFCSVCGTPVGSFSDAAKAVEETVAEKAEETEETVKTAEETVKAAEEAKPAFSPIPEEKPKKEKKGKGGKVAAIVGIALIAVVAVVVCTVVFARNKMGNFVHKTFDKPKDYYSYVEKKNFSAFTGKTATDYVSMAKEKMDFNNRAIKETVKLRLGSRGKDFMALATTAGVDLSWLDSVGISYRVSRQDDAYSISTAPILNDVKILTVLLAMDVRNGQIVGSIPELSGQYIGVSLGETDDFDEIMEEFEKVTGIYEEMLKAYPSPEKLEELATKYYDIAMEQVEEMEKSKTTLEADDISQECIALTMNLKSRDLQKILKAIIKELSKDKDVEKMIVDLCDAVKELDEDIDGEELYEEFLEELEEIEENLDDIEVDKLTLEVYVDNDGNVIGRKTFLSKDGTEITVKALRTRKGENLGYEFSVAEEDDGDTESFVILGNGKEKNGVFNGEFRVKVEDKKVVNFSVEDFDVNELKKGNVVGTITVRLGSDVDVRDILSEVIGGSRGSNPVYALLSGLEPSLRITMERHSFALTLLDGGSEIITLSSEGSIEEAEEITIPTSYISISTDGDYDEEELIEYFKGADFKGIIDSLKEAKVPSDWTSQLEGYVDELMKQLDGYKNFSY